MPCPAALHPPVDLRGTLGEYFARGIICLGTVFDIIPAESLGQPVIHRGPARSALRDDLALDALRRVVGDFYVRLGRAIDKFLKINIRKLLHPLNKIKEKGMNIF